MNSRVQGLFYFFVFLGAVCIARLFHIQLVLSDKFKESVPKQLTKKVKIISPRGRIVDSQGKVLALSIPVYSIFIDPKRYRNSKKVEKEILSFSKLNSSEFHKKLKKHSKKRFMWVQRFLSFDAYNKLNQKNFFKEKGVHFIQEFQRFYPNKSLAAHVIGYTNIDGVGMDGIEYLKDSELRSSEREFTYSRDARGRLIYDHENSLQFREEGIHDIQLTLDSNLQFLTERFLKESLKENNAQSALAVVLNLKNGAVLSLAQEPSFDLNKYNLAKEELKRNLFHAAPIEPGSVFKPFLYAEALEKKKIKKNESLVFPNAFLKIGKKIFKDPGIKERKDFSITEAIQFSSNLAAIEVQSRLGKESTWNLFKKLGFFEKSELKWPGENSSIFKNSSKKVVPIEWATFSFGQGFAVTPFQLLRAYTGLFRSSSYRMDPRFLTRQQKVTHENALFSAPTRENILSFMEGVLEKDGTGKRAAQKDFSALGKTGTSQIADEKNGGYLKNEYRALFVGAIPAKSPDYLIYVQVNRVQGENASGGRIAAPVFKKLALATLLTQKKWQSPDFERYLKEEKSILFGR